MWEGVYGGGERGMRFRRVCVATGKDAREVRRLPASGLKSPMSFDDVIWAFEQGNAL